MSAPVIVFAGVLESMTRYRAAALAQSLGFRHSGTVKSTTALLVFGPGAGSKLVLANRLGVPVVNEAQWLDIATRVSSGSVTKSAAIKMLCQTDSDQPNPPFKENRMSRFSAPISEQIWKMKYQLKDENKQPLELTVNDTHWRIARALAEAEEPTVTESGKARRALFAEKFHDVLTNFEFLPAGRIVAGAGTGRNVTLFNCFVMGTIPDAMGGIFDGLKDAALTMQQGGGIGYDFSTLRPKGALVKGVAADASGPLTFMDVWDAMCRTVMSAGSRRGAMMATMRCDHPDIEQFIEAKQDPTKLRMFNLSVLVTDDFMAAVKNEEWWPLTFNGKVYREVSAPALWEKIMRATYKAAEPGVIFIDRINKANNLRYCETISATNPCGEQPLPPYGACLLGSINAAAFVRDAFGPKAHLDMPRLHHVVRMAVRMLDNVIEISNFPLEAQAREAKAKRRLGLGVTGLADALMALGYRYGSDDAVAVTEDLMREIAEAAYHASVELAMEKEPFDEFDPDEYLAEGTFASTLPRELKDLIHTHGIRNSHLTSVAPTGTISLYANNVSSGIEPVFAAAYDRKVLQDDGSKRTERVVDYAVAGYEAFTGTKGALPKAFVSAETLTPMEHLRMQAAAQKWVDSSISKTINLPETISFEDFQQVYLDAYDMGCKGCTTYRPNEITGSILSVAPAPAPEAPAAPRSHEEAPPARDDELSGSTYKMKWPGSAHAVYVTINDVVENGRRRPFEIFINSKNTEHFAWTVGLTRMLSAVFRRPHDSSFVVEELKQVFDPKGGAWIKGVYVPSILAGIGGVIERHMQNIGYIPAGAPEPVASAPDDVPTDGRPPAISCTSCGSHNVKLEAGCFVCKDCGESKCG